ncbi:1396_t:CDS:2, partial [Acaulospora morrowiae]
EVLNAGSEIPVDGIIDSQDPRPLILPASRSVFLAIERCWADDVFIYGLSHRFWKLSLQLVQRYKNWLMSILAGLMTEKNDQGNDRPISNAKRSPNVPGGRVGSPAPSSTNGNISTEVQDDFLLKRLTIVSHDIENMEIKVKEFYREQ